MPFIQENIRLNGVQLRDTVLPAEKAVYLDQYAKILASAKQQADALLAQAHQDAQQIREIAEQDAQALMAQTQEYTQQLESQAQENIAQLQQSSAQEAQEAVFATAQNLLTQLQQAQENLSHISEPFIKKMMRNVIDKLTQEMDLKDKLYILAVQILEKSRQLDHGMWYFHPDQKDNLPTLHLPPSWQILTDATLAPDACKLVVAGSEWRVSFDNMRHLLLEWFDEAVI